MCDKQEKTIYECTVYNDDYSERTDYLNTDSSVCINNKEIAILILKKTAYFFCWKQNYP